VRSMRVSKRGMDVIIVDTAGILDCIPATIL
jgi:signal recognition particle GTPase